MLWAMEHSGGNSTKCWMVLETKGSIRGIRIIGGMLDEGLKVMQRAYEIEPLMAMIPAQYAQALVLAGRCDEAIPLAEEAEALGGDPSAVTKLMCSKFAGDEEAFQEAMKSWFNGAYHHL